MKHTHYFLLVITVVISLNLDAQAQWKTSLPLSYALSSSIHMLAKGDTLFIGAPPPSGFQGSSWILWSVDGGISWSACKSGLPRTFGRVVSLASDGGNLYAALADSGIYRSTDGGRDWQAINTGLSSFNGKILFLAAANGHLVCGLQRTGGDSLFVSIDAGASWSAIAPAGLPAGPTMQVCASFKGVFYMDVPGTTSDPVYESTDNGSSWTNIGIGLPTYPNSKSVFYMFDDSKNLYVQIYQGDLYKLSGTTWQSVYVNRTQAASAPAGTDLLMTSSVGIKISTDDGSSWNVALPYSSIGSNISIYYGGKSTIIRSDSGIYASSDQGATWIKRNNNRLFGLVNGVSNNRKLFVTDPNGKMYISLDSGKTWETSISLFSKYKDTPSAYLYKDDTLFVAGGSSYYSTDDGATWTQIATMQLNAAQLFLDGIDIYAATPGGVYIMSRTRNYWGFDGTGIDGSVVSMGADSNYLFALSNSEFYRKSRAATSWLSEMSGVASPYPQMYGFVRTSSEIILATGAGIYLSSDEGTNFTKATGLPVGDYVDVNGITTVGSSVIVSIFQTRKASDNSLIQVGGVFMSGDNGQTWRDISDGLPMMPLIGRFAEYNGYLFARGNDGIGWVRPLSETVTAVHYHTGHNPEEFALYQNFPNPFNPTTKIDYRISKYSFVSIKVYDVLGREVATLVNTRKAPGNYEVNFNGSRLSSGIYLYQLKAGSFFETKKLLLLK